MWSDDYCGGKEFSMILKFQEELLGREIVFDSLGNFIDGGVPAELLDVLVLHDSLQTHVFCDLPVHGYDCSDLLFGEQEDLEHEMVTLVGAAAQASLAHENEAGKQYCFESEDCAKQGIGRRIEVANGCRKSVYCDPTSEDDDVQHDEREAPRERRDRVAEALYMRAASEELLLVLGDDIDVFLDVILRHRYWLE
jgi:hypothetical protein